MSKTNLVITSLKTELLSEKFYEKLNCIFILDLLL